MRRVRVDRPGLGRAAQEQIIAIIAASKRSPARQFIVPSVDVGRRRGQYLNSLRRGVISVLAARSASTTLLLMPAAIAHLAIFAWRAMSAARRMKTFSSASTHHAAAHAYA